MKNRIIKNIHIGRFINKQCICFSFCINWNWRPGIEVSFLFWTLGIEIDFKKIIKEWGEIYALYKARR